MKYLDILQNKINLSEEDFNLIKDDVNVLNERLEEKNIKFSDENFEVSFYNHVACLTKRIMDRELVEPLPEEFMDETSEDAKQIALFLVNHIFEKYEVEINKTEIFLLSTHIQLTFN